MAKIGSFVSDPKVGAYCQIKLDDGKILLNHDRPSLDSGTLTITEVKWLGLGSGETFFTCVLESPDGQALRTLLKVGAATKGPPVTPLGALIELLKDCQMIDDVRARCVALLRQARSAAAGGER